ncbi:hypothetical protein MYX78_13870 [Acidobacteria bacterium AH-259-G07]|nr:hypothetical protein [Acidobacteria bacterium AH-259-G07]
MIIDVSKLSSEPIEGLDELFLSYGRGPVPPGTYHGFITEILEVRPIPGCPSTLLKLDFVVSDIVDLKFGSLEEVNLGCAIRWQKVYKNWRKPSMADNLLRSAGIRTQPHSNRELEEMIVQIKEKGKLLTFEVDWEGICCALRDQRLMELTGTSDSDEAKGQASREDWKQANRISLRARSYHKFPDAPDGKSKLDRYFDKSIGEEVIARVKIRRFVRGGIGRYMRGHL